MKRRILVEDEWPIQIDNDCLRMKNGWWLSFAADYGVKYGHLSALDVARWEGGILLFRTTGSLVYPVQFFPIQVYATSRLSRNLAYMIRK